MSIRNTPLGLVESGPCHDVKRVFHEKFSPGRCLAYGQVHDGGRLAKAVTRR
ncbi:hypothetical protein [Streptomyces cavernae]|uniref:hypothetical protein n=1 Tax=Streptomyces cavernae TaxID=2259034 RepID=UPI0012D9E3C1